VPIRVRLAILFAVATALVVSGGGALFIHELGVGLRTTTESLLRNRVTSYLQQISNHPGAIGFSQPGGGENGALSQDGLVLQIAEANGRLLASTSSAGVQPLLTKTDLRQALHHPVYVEKRLADSDSPTLLLGTAIPSKPGEIIVVGASLATLSSAVEDVTQAFVIGGPIAVALAAVAAWLIAGAALEPVEQMRRETADISAHDTNSRINDPGTHDEIAALASTINALLTRLQASLSHQRGFVSIAGHELRTPLAILHTELELANRPGRSRDELARAISSALEETARIEHLAEDLLVLARGEEGAELVRPVRQKVWPILASAASASQAAADAVQVRLEIDVEEALVALVDQDRMRQVVDNLVDNALRYAPPQSAIEIRAFAENSTLVVEVIDSGPGFPPEFIPYAFDRFVRPDDARARRDGGTGLGLAIVKTIVEAQHGSVFAGNRHPSGALLRVAIPGAVVSPSGALPAL
jgi:two-component system OmpR family sensor kinase